MQEIESRNGMSLALAGMAQNEADGGKKIQFLRLEPNQTHRIRLINKPPVSYKRFFSLSSRPVRTGIVYPDSDIPTDSVVRQRYMINVVDLRDGKSKVLDLGTVGMREIVKAVQMKYPRPKIKFEKGFVIFYFIPEYPVIDITKINDHGDPRRVKWDVRIR